MTEPTAGIGEPLIDFDRVLLAGKTESPLPRRGGVSRRALISSARASGRRIVAVTAPAGYGKSTMLAEWAAAEDRPVAWASVDRFDDHPVALLTLLATATVDVSADGARIASAMRGVGASPLGRSAPLLARSWATSATPFVLFIDDLHLAASTDCGDALEIVMSGIPDGAQVVIAGRHEPDFLARMRAEGQVFDIAQDALRLDAAEARTVFAAASVEASDEVLAAAVERCEGWPTGVFLAALATADEPGTEIVGDDRIVADYLYRECLAGLDPDVIDFLHRTAVLEQLSGPLCDAVREAGDSHEMLRVLEARNLFLIPLDRRRQWFRYHALFREFLLGELQRTHPAAVPELHSRAAGWFAANESPRRAVEHLLAAGERERSPVLIAQLAMPTHQAGEAAVVSRWLDDLGEEAIAAFPPLAALAAWLVLLRGESPASERWAATLDRIDVTAAREEIRVAFDPARRLLHSAMCADGPERMLENAELALAGLPEWSAWRTSALHLRGMGALLLGDTRAARRALKEARASAVVLGNTNTHILSEAELAILAADRGNWESARDHADAALQTVDANHMDGYSTTALAFGVAARVAAHGGDSAAATLLLARGMRARVHCTHVMPWLAARVRLQLAIGYEMLGDADAASLLLDEIDAVLLRRPRLGSLVDQVEGFRKTLERSTRGGAATPLTPAEMRLMPYLQTHLTVAAISQRLFVSRNTVNSQLASIYRKLGATTRSTAVQAALEVGLLGE
ncbi:AAA family ATPase [Microbacterium arthrosphaerae]|uniref:AAA family ATPase n=1 Tax=Microbacterium arthrosphaerae TaxID=792652 RepID=UPI0035E79A63